MRDPLGWDYPAGAENDPRAPWNDPGHHSACPAHEDAAVIWSECGGEDECICYPNTWKGRLNRWWDVLRFGEEICKPIEDPECKCSEIADDDAASAADAANDRRREEY